MPLAIVAVFQVVVIGALLNSVVQFTVQQREPNRRLAAVVSSLLLLLLFSIYYARTISNTLLRLDAWFEDQHYLGTAGAWMRDTYFPWWMDHLPTLIHAPDSVYRETTGPMLALAFAYIIRAGIYRFYRVKYPSRQRFASAYWVHITLFFVVLAFLRRVYDYNQYGIAAVAIGSFLLVVGGVLSLLSDAGRGGWAIGRLVSKALVVAWKWLTVGASEFADVVRALRRDFLRLYIRWVRTPLRKLFNNLFGRLEGSEERAEARIKVKEENERLRDGTSPLPPPIA